MKKHPLVSSASHNGVLLCTTCVYLVSLDNENVGKIADLGLQFLFNIITMKKTQLVEDVRIIAFCEAS